MNRTLRILLITAANCWPYCVWIVWATLVATNKLLLDSSIIPMLIVSCLNMPVLRSWILSRIPDTMVDSRRRVSAFLVTVLLQGAHSFCAFLIAGAILEPLSPA